MCFYSDFMAFIEGRHISSRSKKQETINNNDNDESGAVEPTPWRAVLEKLATSFFYLGLNVVLMPLFPVEEIFGKCMIFN